MIAGVVCLIGFFGFNRLRAAWGGIIGMGGCWIILIGFAALIGAVGELTDKNREIGTLLGLIVIFLLCGLYAAHIMLTRCSSTKQRVMLPFVAALIAAAFVWRLIAHVALGMSMGSPAENNANSDGIAALPAIIYDEGNNRWQTQGNFGDHATYVNDSGQRVDIYNATISGSTAITSVGNFHW